MGFCCCDQVTEEECDKCLSDNAPSQLLVTVDGPWVFVGAGSCGVDRCTDVEGAFVCDWCSTGTATALGCAWEYMFTWAGCTTPPGPLFPACCPQRLLVILSFDGANYILEVFITMIVDDSEATGACDEVLITGHHWQKNLGATKPNCMTLNETLTDYGNFTDCDPDTGVSTDITVQAV